MISWVLEILPNTNLSFNNEQAIIFAKNIVINAMQIGSNIAVINFCVLKFSLKKTRILLFLAIMIRAEIEGAAASIPYKINFKVEFSVRICKKIDITGSKNAIPKNKIRFLYCLINMNPQL